MARLINIGYGNAVNSDKIVAVVSPDAAPIKRLVQSARGTRALVDATQGRKTKAVIVTGDDILVLSALSLETIVKRFAEAGCTGKTSAESSGTEEDEDDTDE